MGSWIMNTLEEMETFSKETNKIIGEFAAYPRCVKTKAGVKEEEIYEMLMKFVFEAECFVMSYKTNQAFVRRTMREYIQVKLEEEAEKKEWEEGKLSIETKYSCI